MLPRDLGDGLVMRRATVADTEALATFNSHIHTDQVVEPDERVRVWTQDGATCEVPAVASS